MCKTFKFNVKIFAIIVWIFTISSCVERKSSDVTKKIKTIELGMSKDEVIKILGEPRNKVEYKENGQLYIAMLYEPSDDLDSTGPSVSICKETEVVVQVIVDDSGKYDKRSSSSNPCEANNTMP